MDYKDTIQLPRTAFPMKANLPEKELEILQGWNANKIYNLIQESRKGAKEYIFHDGPPNANAPTHMGTALNRILKDIIVKYKTMAGYRVPFIPGWDCLGMIIEYEVVKELGESFYKLSHKEIRKRCREFAQKYINIQREEFKRLGEFGDWDNPYITMDPKYEAKVIDVFKSLVANGYVYRARRPVHWCTHCKTALAEAELEYQGISSPSIYVKLKVRSHKSEGTELYRNLSILIWTTTPWTLPGNVACALNPEFKYDFIRVGDETLIIADTLKDEVIQRLQITDYRIEKSVPGKELEGISYHHPLSDRECKVILQNWVSKESGTGCVHIAPGHGYEDYQAGLEYNLPILSPVDESGRFTEEAQQFKGEYVFDADNHMIETLKDKELLVHKEELKHSYPHCWRCKNPIIFRATPQWFLRVDHKDLRERCISEIEQIRWIPKWSKERILHNIQGRPDWCLSRQRAWGIPIPVIYCKNCGEAILDMKVIEKAKHIIEKEGGEGWFEHDVGAWLKPAPTCPKCGANEFKKEENILDVWFDSSASWTVMKERNSFPVDLYCEAVDQHRGWFQHSLWLSMIAEEKPCFKSVLTHGLVLDKDMRKMSKSLGNIISPMSIVDKYGADVLRLYFAGLNYTSDLPFDPAGVESTVIAYRKMRNTFKFLLGNLYDFKYLQPSKEGVAYEKLLELDRLMLHKLAMLIKRVKNAYENFEFYKVYHSIYDYCVLDLSKFYFDILKDRLYTYGKSSLERRSAQTVLYETLTALVRLAAPIIPFTAEEVWQEVWAGMESAPTTRSVHLELMPEPKQEWIDNKLAEDYNLLLGIRDDVLVGLEYAREKKLIGNTLEAKVTVWAEDKELIEFLYRKLPLLSSLFIVSQVSICKVPNMVALKKVSVGIERAEGERCERCWIRTKEVGSSLGYPTLCPKCVGVLNEGNYGG